MCPILSHTNIVLAPHLVCWHMVTLLIPEKQHKQYIITNITGFHKSFKLSKGMMESSFTTVNVYLLDCLLEGLNESFHGKQQSFINE